MESEYKTIVFSVSSFVVIISVLLSVFSVNCLYGGSEREPNLKRPHFYLRKYAKSSRFICYILLCILRAIPLNFEILRGGGVNGKLNKNM